MSDASNSAVAGARSAGRLSIVRSWGMHAVREAGGSVARSDVSASSAASRTDAWSSCTVEHMSKRCRSRSFKGSVVDIRKRVNHNICRLCVNILSGVSALLLPLRAARKMDLAAAAGSWNPWHVVLNVV